MKRLFSIFVLAMLVASPAFSMTDSEIAESIKTIYEKRAELKELAAQRQAEEAALVEEYKVKECNEKRNAMIQRYATQGNALMQEIQALEDSLGEK